MRIYISKILILGFFAISAYSQESIDNLLPKSDVFIVTSDPDKAEGEELYRIIDGGAEIYIGHNFKEILATDYKYQDSITLSVEIYRMATAIDAKNLFTELWPGDKTDLTFADDCNIGDYHTAFFKDLWYVSITTAKSGMIGAETRLKLAELVAANVKKKR